MKESQICIRLDENLRNALSDIAEKYNISLSDLIRKILLGFVLNNIGE